MSAQPSNTPRRVENLQTDKGRVPVYATGIVEQPWDAYSADDHATWATLYARQRELLVGRACDEFLQAQDAMGMTPDAIPKFSELIQVLEAATGWTLMGVEGLLPELDVDQALDVARGAHVLVVLTEWPEFVEIDAAKVAELMGGREVVDCRNLLDGERFRIAGLRYQGVGLR